MSVVGSSRAQRWRGSRLVRGAPPVHRRPTPVPTPPPAGPGRLVSFLRRVRAWMVVLPLDAALLLAPILVSGSWKAYVAMTALSLLLLTGAGRYRARLHLSVLDELPHFVSRLLTAAAIVATVIALRHEQVAVTSFLTSVAGSMVLVFLGRAVTTQLILWARRRGVTAHRTLVIGGGVLAVELIQRLRAHPRYGLTVVGFVDDASDGIAAAVAPQLGRLEDLDEQVRRTGADVLLVADGAFAERDVIDAVRQPGCLGCDLLVVPRLHFFHTQTGQADHIGSIPIMRVRTPPLRGPAHALKRAFDVVVAGAGLILVSPALVLCALAVRWESGPGVIFRQARVGRDGVVFDLLKLRSLRPADAVDAATTWSVAYDSRVGPVGRFLRRSSFDELPQLWNIVRGDMSLVGPRPERPHFVDRFSREYDRYAHRHRVKAGLTGLAQVSGLRGDTSIADRARYDNYYIENWSLWLDIKILLRTFGEVLFGRGS